MDLSKRITKRTFFTWLLLAVFIPQMIIKDFHVCHYDESLSHDNSKTVVYQQNSDNAFCPICHFTFSSFDTVEFIALSAAIVFITAIIKSFYKSIRGRYVTYITSLRAPPCLSI